jgi:hypothetical protein
MPTDCISYQKSGYFTKLIVDYLDNIPMHNWDFADKEILKNPSAVNPQITDNIEW